MQEEMGVKIEGVNSDYFLSLGTLQEVDLRISIPLSCLKPLHGSRDHLLKG